MALVSCPRCKNPVSDRAAACPRCGEPAEIVLAQHPTPSAPATHESVVFQVLRWCRQHPIAVGLAIYAMLAVPTLLAAFFHPNDETAYLLTSIAILPGALWGLGFGIWRTLPEAVVHEKLQRLGWSCLFLFLVGMGIWLLANYQFAWYLVGAAMIAGACYIVYLAWKAPQKRPAKISSWYWCGVYLGAMLIGAVSMNAGTKAAGRAQQAKQPQAQIHNSAIVWGKVIEGALLLLGIYIIKESSRAAVVDELTALGRLSLESSQSTDPSAVTASDQSSLTSSGNFTP